jgi:Spy/CpxP family protein refolding chaperone
MKRLIVLALVVFVVAPALAQEVVTLGPSPLGELAGFDQMPAALADPATAPRPKQVVAKALALTAEQVTQWDALLAELENALETLGEQVKANNEQLRAVLEQTSPDPAAVGTLVIKNKALREQIAAAHENYLEGFEALLTAEQKTKLGAIRLANRLQRLLPAFHRLGLLPPPQAQEQ